MFKIISCYYYVTVLYFNSFTQVQVVLAVAWTFASVI